ncbi:hypothetical protein [Mucilaginibacter paludis]|uniref:Uncharacterized protein n=1 Tax=Mucilaginibacter paludis DSM 18603 TaxID=714943 RepID=H1YCL5_9SPHI|nr:hypothetical protein [Mucilaginibacter paludis]EHQ30693.1 hypothetical protein Mucpa_6642 [Mucilaginibacter paludis DSM 18603]
MKKITIIAFVALFTGIAPSYTKDSSIKPSNAKLKIVVIPNKSDVGNGD